jgi:pyruvyltransferase
MLAQSRSLLAKAIEEAGGCIPLSWVDSGKVPFGLCNIGDAASAVVVSAISGRHIVRRAFDSNTRRLVGIGTIGNVQSAGYVHVWGSGFDRLFSAHHGYNRPFQPVPEVEYHIHAVRGPYSRALLLRYGIPTPAIYGDPAWFLPRIFNPPRQIKYELGVIPHISDLASPGVVADIKQELRCLSGGASEGVHVISTWHEPSWEAFQAKLTEILSCRRIISRSFHGMLIADAYHIPCLWMSFGTKGLRCFLIEAGFGQVDHRFADAYRGMGRTRLQGFGLPAGDETPWGDVIKAADKLWEPLDWSGDALLEAFPFDASVSREDSRWAVPPGLLEGLPW